jgi:hypothetical protein
MGAMKDFLIGVEELVYTAMEKGFTDTDGVYAYVYMYEPRVDKRTVEAILESMSDPREMYELEP